MTDKEQATNLINWKELSRFLSGNKESVRRNKVPLKYEKHVTRIINLLAVFVGFVKKGE
jgi:hypothetical protein